jgi:predicted esterase
LTGGPLRFRAHVDAGDYDVEYLVYVPAAYHPAVPAPALISLHGATGSGDNHIHFWLERFRRRDDVFLIAPTAARYGWGRARQGHAAVLAVRRDVLQRWNIDPSRLYLDGASMGGNGSYEIASLYPGRFAAIAPRIGAPLRLRTVDPRTREERVEVRFVENLCATPVFTVVGARDDRIPIEQVRLGRDRMREVGVPLVYHEHADGGHEWFPEEDEAVLEWMLRQRLLRYPNPLWFVTDEEAFPRGYWIEVLEPAGREQIEFQHLDRNNEVAEVRRAYRPDARIRAQVDRDANEIRLNAQGVRRLRLYLHDALVDFEREIVVRANRTVVFRGRVEPSVEFLLEEARRTGEREIVYWGSVDVDVRR